MHHRQLRGLGLSKSAIGRWQHDGRLHELYRGVYAVGHLAMTAKSPLVAALFHAGQGSALSHGTGLHWWELLPAPPAEIHVAVPYRRRPTEGIVFHERRSLDRVFHHRLPVTPVPRTLLDFAATASINEVRKALAQADFKQLLQLESLKSVMGRGRPGSATLRAALDTHLPELAKTLSPLEDEFLFLCERDGIPLPLPNQWIGAKQVDALWPEHRVVVELDSKSAHGSDARRLMDHRRDLELRALGYVVRRYSWHQVFVTPDAVASDLLALLAARTPRDLSSSGPA